MKNEDMKMWKELAKYYDLLYSWKDYEKESETIHKLIGKYKRIEGNKLLDVACGTGNHIQYLKGHYNISGLDLNNDMMDIARKKFPNLKFYKKDMTSFNLKRKFDVITCLFSSIGYVKTYNNLEKTISTFSKHLEKGGVMIIEPFFTKETYHTGTTHATFVDKPDAKICRMNISKTRGDTAILDFYFLIATKKGIAVLRDKHEMGLFEVDKFVEILKNNNLEARFLKNGLMPGRDLYVAVKK